MDLKSCYINSKDVLLDSTSWIYYSLTNRTTLITDDESINYTWNDWRYSSKLFVRSRQITLEWLIDWSWNERDVEAINHLNTIFSIWSFDESWKELKIIDIYNNTRTWKVKLKDVLTIEDYDSSIPGAYWKWRVILETINTPVLTWDKLFVDWVEWQYGWFSMPYTLSNIWDSYNNVIECTTYWNEKTPAKFTINVTWNIYTPLKIRNLNDNTFFALDISAVSWDVIYIDSERQIAVKNWINILANRITWSVFQYINWTTKFTIEDNNWSVSLNDFSVRIQFTNSYL